MRCIRNVFCILIVVLFSGCTVIINDFIVKRPDFALEIGRIVEIDGNTLAFSYGKKVIVFEYKNGRWQYHSQISPFGATKTSSRNNELTSIALKGNILAVGLEGEPRVVGIFQRNSKNNGWKLLKVLRDPLFYPWVNFYFYSLFGSDVAVTDDYVVATPLGMGNELNNGVYLYDCRSKTGEALYANGNKMDEHTDILNSQRSHIEREIKLFLMKGDIKKIMDYNSNSNSNSNFNLRVGVDLDILREYERSVSESNGKILLTLPFLDANDALANPGILGRIIVFEKKGTDWKITGTIDVTRVDIPAGSERKYRLGGNARFSGEIIATTIRGGVLAENENYYVWERECDIYVFERSGDGTWGQGTKIGINRNNVFVMDNGAIVFRSFNDEDSNGKNEILVHRKNESGWEVTDKIIPGNLPEIRNEWELPAISISNDVLAAGVEGVILPQEVYQETPISFFVGRIVDPSDMLKYPGRVCIYRLLPGKGYVLEDVIGRERDRLGRLYFKSVKQ